LRVLVRGLVRGLYSSCTHFTRTWFASVHAFTSHCTWLRLLHFRFSVFTATAHTLTRTAYVLVLVTLVTFLTSHRTAFCLHVYGSHVPRYVIFLSHVLTHVSAHVPAARFLHARFHIVLPATHCGSRYRSRTRLRATHVYLHLVRILRLHIVHAHTNAPFDTVHARLHAFVYVWLDRSHTFTFGSRTFCSPPPHQVLVHRAHCHLVRYTSTHRTLRTFFSLAFSYTRIHAYHACTFCRFPLRFARTTHGSHCTGYAVYLPSWFICIFLRLARPLSGLRSRFFAGFAHLAAHSRVALARLLVLHFCIHTRFTAGSRRSHRCTHAHSPTVHGWFTAARFPFSSASRASPRSQFLFCTRYLSHGSHHFITTARSTPHSPFGCCGSVCGLSSRGVLWLRSHNMFSFSCRPGLVARGTPHAAAAYLSAGCIFCTFGSLHTHTFRTRFTVRLPLTVLHVPFRVHLYNFSLHAALPFLYCTLHSSRLFGSTHWLPGFICNGLFCLPRLLILLHFICGSKFHLRSRSGCHSPWTRYRGVRGSLTFARSFVYTWVHASFHAFSWFFL